MKFIALLLRDVLVRHTTDDVSSYNKEKTQNFNYVVYITEVYVTVYIDKLCSN